MDICFCHTIELKSRKILMLNQEILLLVHLKSEFYGTAFVEDGFSKFMSHPLEAPIS